MDLKTDNQEVRKALDAINELVEAGEVLEARRGEIEEALSTAIVTCKELNSVRDAKQESACHYKEMALDARQQFRHDPSERSIHKLTKALEAEMNANKAYLIAMKNFAEAQEAYSSLHAEYTNNLHLICASSAAVLEANDKNNAARLAEYYKQLDQDQQTLGATFFNKKNVPMVN